jgi:hypothetical protein
MQAQALTRFAIMSLLASSAAACKEEPDIDGVVNLIIAAQDQVKLAIETNPATWTMPRTEGIDIAGTFDDGIGGTITVQGWRLARAEDAASGYHSAFAEKFFFDLSSYSSANMIASGPVVITTHSLDFGKAGGTAIEDASRATHYTGVLTVSGAESGSFQVDVSGVTSNNTQWTCGKVNGYEWGHGACY